MEIVFSFIAGCLVGIALLPFLRRLKPPLPEQKWIDCTACDQLGTDVNGEICRVCRGDGRWRQRP